MLPQKFLSFYKSIIFVSIEQNKKCCASIIYKNTNREEYNFKEKFKYIRTENKSY